MKLDEVPKNEFNSLEYRNESNKNRIADDYMVTNFLHIKRKTEQNKANIICRRVHQHR